MRASRTTAQKTDPLLWEMSKQEALDRMGGRHSARAMQLAVQIYRRAGGGYRGAKQASNSLVRWTRERWQTMPGTPRRAARGDRVHRYLPQGAWKKLSPAERAATDRKKVASRKQFVANTKKAKAASRQSRRGGRR
jgi:hypothetical protein